MDIDDKFGFVDTDSTDSMFGMFNGESDAATEVVENLDEPTTPILDTETEDSKNPPEDKSTSINDFLTEIPDNEEENEDTTSSEEQTSPFEDISKELLTLGIFTEDEEDPLPTTGEDLAKRFEKESVRKTNENLSNFLSKFGKDKLDAFRAIYVNGVDPKEYFSISAKPEDILSLDMEQESNQKRVVKKYYQEVLGHSETRTDKLIQMLIDDGELDGEAVTALDKFKTSRDTELQRLEDARIAAEQQKLQEKQFFTENVNKFISAKVNEKDIDGFKFDKNVSEQINRSMTQGAWKLPSGEIITDFEKFIADLSRPENIEIAFKIALLRENNFDFSKMQLKKANIEKNKAFSSLVQKNKTINRNSSTQKVDSFSILD